MHKSGFLSGSFDSIKQRKPTEDNTSGSRVRHRRVARADQTLMVCARKIKEFFE